LGADWLRSQTELERATEVTALVIAWSAVEPHRVGEVALIADDAPDQMLGRGEVADSPVDRLAFHRQRPGSLVACPPIQGPAISQEQVLLRPAPGGLQIERVGRCGVLLSGSSVDQGLLRPGDTLSLKHQLVLYCTRRTAQLPALRSYPAGELHRFGEPDPHGMVGESATAWELRDQLAFAAHSDRHALLVGESGSGKELAAQALHALSRRGERPLVARNAATFPTGIIDAELFGNVKDYPNAGMDARPGLIGEADGSTLFLDEIAELPMELQAHLLRVLDAKGEYQRLGDAQMRRADLRIVAATNRALAELKQDLLARLTLRVEVPGLPCRRDDVPLLVRHMLKQAAAESPDVGERFFGEVAGAGPHARIEPSLVDLLVRHRYTHHARELEGLLWEAIAHSPGKFIALTEGVADKIEVEPAAAEPVAELSPEEIRACLERHDGKVSRAWRELGLNSRYALYRLIKKYGLDQ
jgi:two-component system nitrogen regulation response regulator GlnG/two-component system response regulator HydG